MHQSIYALVPFSFIENQPFIVIWFKFFFASITSCSKLKWCILLYHTSAWIVVWSTDMNLLQNVCLFFIIIMVFWCVLDTLIQFFLSTSPSALLLIWSTGSLFLILFLKWKFGFLNKSHLSVCCLWSTLVLCVEGCTSAHIGF